MNVQIETRRMQAERSKATALWVIAWCAVLWTVLGFIGFMINLAVAGRAVEVLSR